MWRAPRKLYVLYSWTIGHITWEEAKFTRTGLVVEDAPAGIQSGKAAGCQTLAVTTSHSRERMAASRADYLVDDLSRHASQF